MVAGTGRTRFVVTEEWVLRTPASSNDLLTALSVMNQHAAKTLGVPINQVPDDAVEVTVGDDEVLLKFVTAHRLVTVADPLKTIDKTVLTVLNDIDEVVRDLPPSDALTARMRGWATDLDQIGEWTGAKP